MPDVVVTVPKAFRYAGKRGLAAWIAEGCLPGEVDDDPEGAYIFVTFGPKPDMRVGERVYVVCEGRLRGYAPLVEMAFRPRTPGGGLGRVSLIRSDGAVAVTIPERIVGFRGWRRRWWQRKDEVPFPNWMTP
jgi:hypothetical protein